MVRKWRVGKAADIIWHFHHSFGEDTPLGCELAHGSVRHGRKKKDRRARLCDVRPWKQREHEFIDKICGRYNFQTRVVKEPAKREEQNSDKERGRHVGKRWREPDATNDVRRCGRQQ